jgi:hypothetical protein
MSLTNPRSGQGCFTLLSWYSVPGLILRFFYNLRRGKKVGSPTLLLRTNYRLLCKCAARTRGRALEFCCGQRGPGKPRNLAGASAAQRILNWLKILE